MDSGRARYCENPNSDQALLRTAVLLQDNEAPMFLNQGRSVLQRPPKSSLSQPGTPSNHGGKLVTKSRTSPTLHPLQLPSSPQGEIARFYPGTSISATGSSTGLQARPIAGSKHIQRHPEEGTPHRKQRPCLCLYAQRAVSIRVFHSESNTNPDLRDIKPIIFKIQANTAVEGVVVLNELYGRLFSFRNCV